MPGHRQMEQTMTRMPTAFWEKIDETSLAVMDLVDYYGLGLIITRINVPRAHRRQGIGTRLLLEALRAADEMSTTLYLEVGGDETGPTYDQLRQWYRKHGFADYHGIMRRLPHA